ncbi:MAG: hypothetical protein QOF62_966 [Pyrinomonadaceae bacterium]|jgi:hypothetical protein|nr:hypothetical protein [Pyrinomonadaceae bacterium]
MVGDAEHQAGVHLLQIGLSNAYSFPDHCYARMDNPSAQQSGK